MFVNNQRTNYLFENVKTWDFHIHRQYTEPIQRTVSMKTESFLPSLSLLEKAERRKVSPPPADKTENGERTNEEYATQMSGDFYFFFFWFCFLLDVAM